MRCSFYEEYAFWYNLLACVMIVDFTGIDLQISSATNQKSITALDTDLLLPDVTTFQTSINSSCYAQSINVSYKKNSVSIAAIPFLSFSSELKSFQIDRIPEIAESGVYEILITASLPRVLENDAILKRELIFTLTVVDPCLTTPYLIRGLRDMQIKLGFQDTQNVYIDYELRDKLNLTGVCGPRIIDYGNHSFLSMPVKPDLILSSTDNADVLTHLVTLTYTFVNYPGRDPLTRQINVTILCGTVGISFSQKPLAQYIIKVGLTTLPFTINVATQQLTQCESQVTFVLSSVDQYAQYVQLTTDGVNSAKITIDQIPLGTQSILNLNIQATVDAQTASENFQVILQDPCETATFQTTNPLQSLLLTIGVDDFKTMSVRVKTDAEEINSQVICPIKATITSTMSFISVSPDSSQITVNSASVQVPTDLGVHQFTLKVESSTYTSITAEYQFQVEIVCQINRIQINTPLLISHNCHPKDAYAPTVTTVQDVSPSHGCGAISTLYMSVTPNLPFISFSGKNMVVDTEVIQYLGDNNLTLRYIIPSSATVIGKTETKAVTLRIFWDLCDTATVHKISLTFTTLKYKIAHPALVQPFIPFTDSGAQKYNFLEECGPKEYFIEPSHPFISIEPPTDNKFVDDWSISIKSIANANVGIYQLKLVCRLPNYPLSVPTTHEFSVEMIDTCLTTFLNKAPSLKEMTTIVKNPPVNQFFYQLTDSSALSTGFPSICGERQYRIVDPQPFIKLVVPDKPWESPFVISLETRDPTKVGSYIISIETTLKDYPSNKPVTSSFPVLINPNRLPYFKTKLVDTVSIKMTESPESWTLEIPKTADDDGDLVRIIPDFGDARFVILNGNSIEISDISATETGTIRSGMYFLKYILSDGKDEASFSQLLLVNPASEKQKSNQATDPEQKQEAVCDATLEMPSYDRKVHYSSGSNGLTVRWGKFELKGPECIKELTVSVKIIPLWQDMRIKMASDWVTYTQTSIQSSNSESYVVVKTNVFYDSPIITTLTVQASVEGRKDIQASFLTEVVITPQQRKQSKEIKVVKPPVMSIKSFNEEGLLTIEFNEPIMTQEGQKDDFSQNPLKFLSIQVIKNPKSQIIDQKEYIESGSILSIEVKEFTARLIEIQLRLSNPLYISYDPFNGDKLTVTIINPQNFVSSEDFITTAVAMSSDTIQVPKQLSEEMAQTATSIQSNQKLLVNSLSTSSLTLNIFLGLSLKYLWGMINVLQFVIYMRDWRLNWPTNASLAVKTLRTVALAEFIDYKKMGQKVLAFYGYKPKQKSGRLLQGIMSKEHQRLLLTVIIVTIVVLVVIPLLVMIYRNFSSVKAFIKKQVGSIKKKIFWNGMIRFYLQSFLKFSIQTFAFFFGLKRSNIRQVFSIFGLIFDALLSLMIYVLVPYMIYKVLHKHQYQLFLTYNKQRFGSLYLGIKIREFSTILNVFNFLGLRFLFVVLTFSMQFVPGILVNVYMLLNNFNIIYVGWYQPYDTRAQNRIELANSFLLHIVAYHLLLLANLLPNPEVEYKLGWSIITTIGLIFVLNMGYILSLTIRVFFLKIYMMIKKRRERQRLIKEQIARSQSIQTEQKSNTVELKLRTGNINSNGHILANITGQTLEERQNVEKELEKISSLNESYFQKDLYVLPSRIRRQRLTQTAQTLQQKTQNARIQFLRDTNQVRPSRYEEPQKDYESKDSVFVSSVDSQVQKPYKKSDDSVFVSSVDSVIRKPHEKSNDSVFVSSVHSEVPRPQLKSNNSVFVSSVDSEHPKFDQNVGDSVFVHNDLNTKAQLIVQRQSNDSVFVPSVPSEEDRRAYKLYQEQSRFFEKQNERGYLHPTVQDLQPVNLADQLMRSGYPNQPQQFLDQKNKRRLYILDNHDRQFVHNF